MLQLGGPCPGGAPPPPPEPPPPGPPAGNPGVADGAGDVPTGMEGVGTGREGVGSGRDGVGSGEVETDGKVGDGRTGGLTAGTPAEETGRDGSGVGDGTPRTAFTCCKAVPGVKLPEIEADAETGKKSTMAATEVRSSARAGSPVRIRFLPHCDRLNHHLFPSTLPVSGWQIFQSLRHKSMV